ncbi:hypothetical protein D9756_005333 [Leucocoprinus leucothites]|uniref:RMT2 domain-containing protein n=1 Tax=Leucocoprinus leucothites TaxID=201217 RepID=A0A8H5D6Z8_9AGAR|nr:hypothetical protein D9756_005333 [Leucoagaricus leucothites]
MGETVDTSEIAAQLGEQLIEAILQNAPTTDIQSLVETGAPVWYQNEAEGMSPLHAAAYTRNFELVQFLIGKGAVWNAGASNGSVNATITGSTHTGGHDLVDYLQNTAGDIALSYNDEEIYYAIRNEGIRAELLLNLLSSRGGLAPNSSTNLILQETDATAASSSENFLSSKLRYTKDETGQDICFISVDGEDIGVMMGWETPIMMETVQSIYDSLPERDNLKVLNVGFGLGIIDRLFQALPSPPAQHVIIEPHPDVIRYMRENSWHMKPGVKILEGKWQDFVEKEELIGLGGFDVVYVDTFSENYQDLRQFFGHLPNLLSGPHARFSFFNGLGATNPLFYDVYSHISELHLADIGLDVQWSNVDARPQNPVINHTMKSFATKFQSRTLNLGLIVCPSTLHFGPIFINSYTSGFAHNDHIQPLHFRPPECSHCTCVYYHDWHRTKRPRPAAEGNILPAVSQVVSPAAIAEKASANTSTFSSPRNTLSSSTGIVVASNENPARSAPPLSVAQQPSTINAGLPFDEEAKLVYGVVLSLRNMVKKLSGRDESFTSYRTSTYKLHLHETVSGYKFIMLTDPKTDSLRFVLRQIYAGPFVEYVVRNPLVNMDSKEYGIDNEYFRTSVDRLVRGLSIFA